MARTLHPSCGDQQSRPVLFLREELYFIQQRFQVATALRREQLMNFGYGIDVVEKKRTRATFEQRNTGTRSAGYECEEATDPIGQWKMKSLCLCGSQQEYAISVRRCST